MIDQKTVKKKRIGLIELYGHNEVLYNFYKLLKNDFELTIFTTQEIFVDAQDYFENKLNDWQIKPSSISIESFIKEHLEKLDAQNIVIFTTLISSFKFFATINFRSVTILTIHNVNTTFNFNHSIWLDKSSIRNYLFDLLRFLRMKVRRDQFFRERLLNKVNYVFCLSENLSNYAESTSTDHSSKILKPLPFSFFEDYKKEVSQKEIIISIPGSVTNKLKDYEIVYEALKEIIPKSKRTIKLQLLGISKYKIEEQIRNLVGNKFQLLSFNKYLSQKEFDHYLKQTDFIILPIKKYKKFGIIREEYGKSSISGGVNDIIRFGIPALLIDSYQIEKSFAPLISTFRNKTELVEKMIDWIEHSKYIEMRRKALIALEKVNEENTRINLVNQLENLLT